MATITGLRPVLTYGALSGLANLDIARNEIYIELPGQVKYVRHGQRPALTYERVRAIANQKIVNADAQ